MIPGATSTQVYTVAIAESDIERFRITYKHDKELILRKTSDECKMEGQKIVCNLSQQDTLKFINTRNARVQIKFLRKDGNVVYTKIFSIAIGETLDDEVI